MKTMTELRSLSLEELRQRLSSEQEILQKLRFAHAISPIENPMKLRDTKKLIARVKSLLKEKELQANTTK
jgi:large subunit ribosomal protein L29